eukprot:4737473-Prymnesium_polylepis.1
MCPCGRHRTPVCAIHIVCTRVCTLRPMVPSADISRCVPPGEVQSSYALGLALTMPGWSSSKSRRRYGGDGTSVLSLRTEPSFFSLSSD